MNAPAAGSSQKILGLERDTFFYLLGALCLFTFGYLMVHGLEAMASGSWKYILRHNDEFGYWVFARGAAETPISDANPFYFEEIGSTHTLPFTTSLLVGFAAKLLSVPVMSFFPWWHIGMPFVLWSTSFFCMNRVWGYPKAASAAVTSLLLLSTLFMTSSPQMILYRFSRPGDGLWLVILWVSLVMNLNSQTKRQTLWLGVIAFAAFWLQPYYAVLGCLVTGLEALWQYQREKNVKKTLHLAAVLGAVLAAAATYYCYVKTHMIDEPWFFITNEKESALPQISPPSLILYALIMGMVIGAKRLGRLPFTKLDRTLLFIFLIEPIATHIQFLTSSNLQFATHRYYFLLIEMAAVTAWACQKIPRFLEKPAFKQNEKWIWPGLAVISALLALNPATNFFRYLPVTDTHYYTKDNAVMLMGLIPLIFLGVRAGLWSLTLAAHTRKRGTVLLITALALFGYTLWPSQIRHNNVDFPFDGAYEWLNENAEPKAVVLTVSPLRRWMSDYLMLYTKQKSYFDEFYGKMLPSREGDQKFRIEFYATLLMGHLPQTPINNLTNLEDKLTFLRLDYLLMPVHSAFRGKIEEQLRGHLETVYEDEHSLIWKIKI